MRSFSSRYQGIAFGVLAAVLLVLVFLLVRPFIPAILWALVLSILLYPLYERWAVTLRKKPLFRDGRAETSAALMTTLSAAIIIIVPFLLVGGGIYLQVQGIAEEISGSTPAKRHPLSVEGVLQYVDSAIQPMATSVGLPKFSAADYVRENRKEIVDTLRQPLTKAASGVAFTVLTIVIALLTMFFMLRDGSRLREPAASLIPLPRDRIEALFKRCTDTVWAVFVGTVLVAIVQGTVLGLTFYFLDVPNSLLLGVFAIILCIIPLLGSPVLYIPVGLLFLIKGDTTPALVVFIMGFGVVSNIDNLLKPFLIGGRANLHPMPVFFAILGGVLLIGAIGIMAGPLLLTAVLFLFDVIQERVAMSRDAALPESATA